MRNAAFLSAAVAFCLTLAGPAPAAESAWKQETVAELAGTLARATDDLYAVFYRQSGGDMVGSGQATDFFRLKHKLRRIRVEARHLADDLRHGKSREETTPAFRELMEDVRDARELVERIFVSGELGAALDRGRAAVNALAPYYGAKPLPEPVRR